jgi:hypothetical protein
MCVLNFLTFELHLTFLFNFSAIDRAVKSSGCGYTSPSELLLDEWGTMGQFRPTVEDLLCKKDFFLSNTSCDFHKQFSPKHEEKQKAEEGLNVSFTKSNFLDNCTRKQHDFFFFSE